MEEKTKPKIYLDATHWERVAYKFGQRKREAVCKGVLGSAAQEAWHEKVLKVLEEHGVPRQQQFHYIGYADGLKYKVMRYPWKMDRILEHAILRMKWEKRGLDPKVLDAIDALVPWNTGLTPGGGTEW
jgi:hypothetical protein